ncbi:MAG: hypothetical protein LBR15_10420 [Methanobrevibacter sp.]|jgi:hypothetical protein|nr:hypothetical protein [Candidatus Methanovirga australis]
MFKKIFAIGLITILAISCIGTLSAAKIHIDGDWRLVHNFQFYDLSSNEEIWDRDVAAGDSHSLNFEANPHKLHQISITVTPKGITEPDFISKIINVYQGGDIDVYADLSYNWRKVRYDFSLSKCIVDGRNI